MPLRKVKADLDLVKEGRDILNKDLKGVYFAGLKNIVESTPVDSGRARNNWFLSVGTPHLTSSARGDSGTGAGSISSITSEIPKSVLDKKLYFTNNLPYIATLEYGGYPKNVKKGSYDKDSKSYVKLSSGGFSLQAPDGWVRKTLKKMQRVLANL